MGDVDRPGRLGDDGRTLGTDPRVDPRVAAAWAPFGLDGAGEPPPVTPESPIETLREFCTAAEAGFAGLFLTLGEGLPSIEGVESETVTVPGRDGNEIQLFVHRPAGGTGARGAVFHIHGGGMVLLAAADPNYVRWREELAATGLVVIGVEYRNGGGKLGPYPYPAGLDDCIAGLRWVLDRRDELGLSHVVVSGESGGANLTLAVSLRAMADGWIDEIAGVYAQCPYISNEYAAPPPELPSLTENDGYFLRTDLLAVLARIYDPTGEHDRDPRAWPYHVDTETLRGMPPHVISVNELDPLRDEGLAYYRKLLAADVSAVGRIVPGTSHAADVLLRAAIPDIYAASVRDVSGFVAAVAPH